MPIQSPSANRLPRAISIIVILGFLLHIAFNIVYQFGKDIVPDQMATLTDRYMVPWFHQNYVMFAPDPATEIHTFVYRAKVSGDWSTWKIPVYAHQLDHWSNKFGPGSDMYDILNGVADALYNGANNVHFRDSIEANDWFLMPGFQLAEKFVMEHSPYRDETIEAFQVGVYTEHHLIDNSQVRKTYLFTPYPTKVLDDE